MDPYEDIKKRMLPPKPDKDKKECTTCKKKLAQEQFDMIANGSSYLPQMSLVRPGPDVIEVMWGNGGTTQTQPTTTAKKYDAIGELYGGRLPVSKPFDAIGELYGGKLPKSRKVDAIGELYRGIIRSYSSEEPCQKDKEGRFQFPNRINSNMNSLFQPFDYTCIFDLTLEYNKNRIDWITIPMTVDIVECCKKLIEELYCSSTDEEISDKFNNFKNCVREKIFNKYLEVVTQYKLPQVIPIDFYENILEIENKIEHSKRSLINLSPREKSFYTGFRSKNKESCLCGGKTPTRCCSPEDDPEKCFCPDGSYKNLCEDCPKEEEEFVELPIIVSYYYTDGKCTVNFSDNESHKMFIQYAVYEVTDEKFEHPIYPKSGLIKLTALYKLTDEEQKELIPYGVNASSNRRLTINVPKDRMVNVVFWIYFPCGACCYRFNDPTLGPDMNKRRVLRRVFAFNPIQRNDEQKRWEFGITAIEASRINGEEWDKLLPCENCY